MADLEAQEGLLEMTIQVKRKETGKVEEYKLTSIPEKQTVEEEKDGNNTHNSI